ncbi:GNAT family N-acetyltransferase [Pseudoxanthomonas putridarboris]|uniref:GNAT family N-acetyltransferase n=2 Tax=Pseudoxanthomonas putridarboris TaxID=752605 RepID=A0ABU9J0C8_9GAMM
MNAPHKPRLLLRALDERDKDFYTDLYADPEVMRSIGEPWSAKTAGDAFFLACDANKKADADFRCWLILSAEGFKIGIAALMKRVSNVELGIMVAPEWQRRGVGSLVLEMLVRLAFEEHGSVQILCRHRHGNEAWTRLMARSRFSQDMSIECASDLRAWRFIGEDKNT